MKSLDELEAIARARNEALWGWWRVEDLPKVYAELQADAPFIAAMSPDTALKLIADARRYQFLRDSASMDFWRSLVEGSPNDTDAAIDAALSAMQLARSQAGG